MKLSQLVILGAAAVEAASITAGSEAVPARAYMKPLPASLTAAPHLAPAVAAINDLAMLELTMTVRAPPRAAAA